MKRWLIPEEGIQLEWSTPAPVVATPYKSLEKIGEMLNGRHPWIKASWESTSYPEYFNETLDLLEPDAKKYHLCWDISSYDFQMAVAGGGPEVHNYANKHPDLRWVITGIPQGWGLFTYDPNIKSFKDLAGKTIGDYNPDGTPHTLLMAILKAAGVLDQVKWKYGDPTLFGPWMWGGAIDALWNGQVFVTPDGRWGTNAYPNYDIWRYKQVYWVALTQDIVDKVNADPANDFDIGLVTVPKGAIFVPGPPSPIVNPPADVSVLRWDGLETAWASTDEEVVYELLKFFAVDNLEAFATATDRQQSVQLLATRGCLGLTKELIHPGTLRFFEEQGIEIKLG